MWALFPEGGTDRFAASAFWPMLAISAGGVALIAPRRRTLLVAGLLYLAVLVGAFVVPSPFGQNALRLGVLAGPSVLALAHRRRPPVLALAVVGVGLVYLQWLPAVRAVAEAHGDPSTHAAFQDEARDFLERVAKPGERVEVPLTLNHWEAADLAQEVPLARGWERQLDRMANPIFYSGKPLTAAALPRLAARQRRPLGRAAQHPARLLGQGGGEAAGRRAGLPPAGVSLAALAHLAGARDRPARIQRRAGAGRGAELVRDRRAAEHGRALPVHEVLDLERRLHRRSANGWTSIHPDRAGVVMVRARFDLEPRPGAACSG